METGAEEGMLAGVYDIAGVETDFLNPFYYAPGDDLRWLERNSAQYTREIRAETAGLNPRWPFP
jgi:hypothetical protein